MDPILKIGGMAALAAVVVVAVSSVGRRTPPPVPAYTTPQYSLDLDKRLAARQAAVGPNAPKASATANGVELRSVGFEIPTDGRAFPPGPHVEAMNSNCQSCHTPGMILTQPKLTRAEWTGEVTKMINVYKAPVDPAEVPAIVDYLASLQPEG